MGRSLALVAAAVGALALAGTATAAAELAFVENGHVALWDPATATTRQVTHGDGPFRADGGDLALSPDGTRIAYTARLERGTTVRVVRVDGRRTRDVTPWATPYLGFPAHSDPLWLSPTRISYLDATGGSGGLAYLRSVDLATGARALVMRRLIASRRLPYGDDRVDAEVVPYAGGPACADTTDIVLHSTSTARRLTRTPEVWEQPLDAQPGAGILVSAQRVVAGLHRGGCLLGPVTIERRLLAVQADGSSGLVVDLGTASDPEGIDAAWSPDGTLLAYANGRGRLVVRRLATGEETALAESGATALDW